MAKKATKDLPVDDLVLDAGTQPRLSIDEDTVEDYAEVLSADEGWPFPPLDVFHDGSRYLVSSGFHRTLAARRVERPTVPCIVHKGTAWDAFLFGIEANLKNGLRPNRDDKRHMVERLLDSEEYTQGQVATIVGVSLRTVSRIASELKTDYANGIPDDDSDDPFTLEDDYNEDPFGVSSGATAEPDETPTRTPAEEFKIQRQKTVKTAEALVREFCGLNEFKEASHLETTLEIIEGLIQTAKKWPKQP